MHCGGLLTPACRKHTLPHPNFLWKYSYCLKVVEFEATPLTSPLHQLGTPKIFMFYKRTSVICDILYSGSNTMQEHQKVGIAASRAEEC